MSQETKAVSFAADGHPDEDQLLLALEHELPADDAARVEKHLGNCWSCRARFDEMQRGILAFVEYREQRYLPYLPAPPADSSGFRDRLRNLLREDSPIGLPTRVWRKLVALLVLPKQLKWVSAVATVMAIAQRIREQFMMRNCKPRGLWIDEKRRPNGRPISIRLSA